MNDFASQAGHFYTLAGEPMYEIVGKNGKLRQTNVRDARELNLVPSVTTIIRCAAAPRLEQWKREQVLLAALTLPRRPGELEADWLRRVEQDWQAQGRAAADRGTAIHAAIEKHYRGEPDPDWWEWVKVAKDAIEGACGPQNWKPERSFATFEPRPYGGKLDLHSDEWVIDVKTKDQLAGKTLRPRDLYDEHHQQLSAYARGVGLTTFRAGILFVDRAEPVATFVEADPQALREGLEMFDGLLAYWYAKSQLKVAA